MADDNDKPLTREQFEALRVELAASKAATWAAISELCAQFAARNADALEAEVAEFLAEADRGE